MSLLWSVFCVGTRAPDNVHVHMLFIDTSRKTLTCVKLCIKRTMPLIIVATNACPCVEKLRFDKCRTLHTAPDVTSKCLGLLFVTRFSDALEYLEMMCLLGDSRRPFLQAEPQCRMSHGDIIVNDANTPSPANLNTLSAFVFLHLFWIHAHLFKWTAPV